VTREAAPDHREVSSRTADATGALPLRRFDYRPYLQGGSVTLDPAARRLFALDSDNGTLAVVDVRTLRVERTIRVCDGPEQVVVSPNGRAFVSCREEGVVVSVDPASGEGAVRRRLGAEPFGLALSPDAGTLFVTTANDARLHALTADGLGLGWSLPVAAHPRGVAVSPDGGHVVVAHLMGGGATVVDVGDRRIRSAALPNQRDGWVSELFDFATLEGLPTRVAGGAFAVAMSPGGTRAFVPYVLKNDGSAIETFQPGCYANGASVPSAATVAAVNLRSSEVQRPMPRALPPGRQTEEGSFGLISTMASLGVVRAAFHDPVRSRLFAVGDGSGVLVAFDSSKADPTSAPMRSWELGGPARGVVVDRAGRRAYVHLPFDHQIVAVDLEAQPGTEASSQRVTIGRETLGEEIALGRRLFHTANDFRMAGLAGMACTTCHLEGREDGVTWRLDGQPLQTPMLSGRVREHGPLRWRGDSPDLGHAVREAVTRLRGQGLPDPEIGALVAFLTSGKAEMEAPVSPHTAVARGSEVFDEAGCASCHSPETDFTDGEMHEVRGTRFRTPSLRGVFLSAPYYHDGTAASLHELLAAHDARGNPMAVGSRVSREDLGALEAYLRSL